MTRLALATTILATIILATIILVNIILALCDSTLSTALILQVHKWPPAVTTDLVNDITLEGVYTHLEALQSFADASNNTRSFGTPGYNASKDYFANLARDAGYTVTEQSFPHQSFEIYHKSLTINATSFPTTVFRYSRSTPENGVTSGLVAVPNLGCESTDYEGLDMSGQVALVSRGTCTFLLKTQNAFTAGAAALIIYNNVPSVTWAAGNLERFEPNTVPVTSLRMEEAASFVTALGAGETISATINLQTASFDQSSANVIAESAGGNENEIIFIGAHLDSVPAGPGINDNGSGSSVIAEVMKQLSKYTTTRKVKFGWWTAEEAGLVGAQYYVDSLSQEERDKIIGYINIDMASSPNGVLAVHDGKNASGRNENLNPEGSAQLEDVLRSYFTGVQLPTVTSPFTNSSDYGPFADAGIPAGGLDTGAGSYKTEKEATLFGGKAGEPYDANYHTALDTIININTGFLLANAKAIAFAVATLAGAPNTKFVKRSAATAFGDNLVADLGKCIAHSQRTMA